MTAPMPKDNEVDEKVMPVAWIVTNGGESCEPWLEYEESEVDALPAVCIAEPLYSAATVAELRAEVDRLRKSNELYSFAMNTAGIDELKRRADAAERRVGELKSRIQSALANVVVPKMSESRAEYFKAGARAAIAAVNDALTGADPT